MIRLKYVPVKAGEFAVEQNDLPKWVSAAWAEFLFKTKNAYLCLYRNFASACAD
jgi:hypothetical protein